MFVTALNARRSVSSGVASPLKIRLVITELRATETGSQGVSTARMRRHGAPPSVKDEAVTAGGPTLTANLGPLIYVCDCDQSGVRHSGRVKSSPAVNHATKRHSNCTRESAAASLSDSTFTRVHSESYTDNSGKLTICLCAA